MKVVILDSGILINLSLNGLLDIIPSLKKLTGVRFAITNDVKFEVVDRPMHVPRFELGALRVMQMINSNNLELPAAFGVSDSDLNLLRDEMMQTANHCLRSKDRWIQIVSNAEISCLALSKILTEKKVDNIIGVDERTIRLLSEKPENLENIMSAKLHERIKLDRSALKGFEGFRFIRSTELVYVAFKKDLLNLNDSRVLEAALYATKFHGSSVSFEEIKVLKKL